MLNEELVCAISRKQALTKESLSADPVPGEKNPGGGECLGGGVQYARVV